jgi:hypothetical protein
MGHRHGEQPRQTATHEGPDDTRLQVEIDARQTGYTWRELERIIQDRGQL